MATLNGVAWGAPSRDEAETTDAAASTATGGSSFDPGLIGTSLADIDVTSFLIRNLYREPDKDVSDLDKWFRGWAISLYWNPNMQVHSTPRRDDFSKKGFGFAISKDVSPASTFRLGGSVTKGQGYWSNADKIKVSLDYLFNISNFYYGYDLSRQNEWLLSIGLQGGVTKPLSTRLQEDHKAYRPLNQNHPWAGAHLGLQYRKNISNDLAFFLEQQFEYNSNAYDGTNNQYHVDPAVNMLVGLLYRMGAPKRNVEVRDEDYKYRWYDNTFIQMYGGLSDVMTTEGLTFDGAGDYHGEMPGLNFGFSVGKWLNPSLGVRLGYFEQVIGHNSKAIAGNPDYSNFMTLRGGRAELLFNPLNVFADKISVGRFGWDISAGLELGQFHLHHEGYNNYFPYSQSPAVTFSNGNKLNLAFTMGTQLKYFVNNHTALFLEGRTSTLAYHASKEDGFNKDTDASEPVYSASLGLEYYLSAFNRYSRFNHWDTYETKPVERLSDDKRVYLEMAGGLGHQTHWGEHFPNMFDIEGTVGIGMRYNDYIGGRARFSYGYRNSEMFISSSYSNENVGRPSSIFRVGADFTFNLSNFWLGLDPEGMRIADLYLFAGPLYAGYTDDLMHGTVGGNVGLQLTRRLSPEWEIFLEPRYEFYQKALTNRWDLLAGVIYHYNAEKNEEYKGERTKHHNRWFFELGAGAGLAFDETLPGLDGRIAFGRRFTPYSSIRLNNLLTWVDPLDKREMVVRPDGKYTHEYKFEVGLDYMFNLSNLWYGVNPFRNTNMRAFVGPTMQLMNLTVPQDMKLGYGMEAGVQWSYDINKQLSLSIEPRYQHFFQNNYSDRFDILFGLIWYNDYRSWRANRLYYNDDEHYPWALVESGYVHPEQKSIEADERNRNWFWEVAGGLHVPTSGWEGNNILSPAMMLGLGYNFNNYSALRLSGVFSKHREDLYTNGPLAYDMTAALDYRFNLTNLIMGINPYRPMDAYIFAGPEVRLYDWGKRSVRNTFAIGAMAGGHLAYHLTQNLDLFGELRYTNYGRLANLSNKIPVAGIKDKNRAMHNNFLGLVGATWYNKEFDHTRMKALDDAPHMNNWFYQMAGGISHALEMTSPNATFAQTNSLSGFGAMGYTWGPLSSLRVNGTFHYKKDGTYDVDGSRYHIAGGLDYMFHLSNLLLGINPYRRFDLQLLGGPQVRLRNLTSSEGLDFNYGVMGGAQLSYHLNSNVDFFGEARYELWKNAVNRANLYAGIAYYAAPADQRTHQFITDPTARENNWFWSAMLGVTHPRESSDYSGMDLFSFPAVSGALGYRFGKYSSLRLDGNYSKSRYYYWGDATKHLYNMNGELAYMFNLTNLMMGQDSYRPLDFYLLGGANLRALNLTNIRKLNFALGEMVGAQLAYRLGDNWDIFGEARYNHYGLFSSINDKWGAEGLHSMWDLYMGATWYTTHLDHTHIDQSRNKAVKALHSPVDQNLRYKNWFYQLAVGGSLPSQALEGSIFGNLSAGAYGAIGYTFDKYSSVRANLTGMRRLNKSNYLTHDVDGRYLVAEGGIEYMLNTTNLILGINPYRRFDISLLLGPELRVLDFRTDGHPSYKLGAMGAGQLAYHINPQWDIFAEGRYDFQRHLADRLDGFLGVTYYNRPYNLRTGNWITDVESHYGNWFAETALGLTMPIQSTKIGVSDKLAVGYVMGPFSTLRLGMLNHWHFRQGENLKEHHKYVLGANLDYMLNLTNLFTDDARRRTELLAYAGIATRIEDIGKGKMANTWRLGGLVGGQINYHLNQYTDLFLAGQYEAWPQGNNEDRLSGYMGTRFYNHRNEARVPGKGMIGIEDKKTLFVDLGYGIGTSGAPTTAGNRALYFDQALHAGAGIHFNPYLSARARMNLTLIGDAHRTHTAESNGHLMEVTVDGMWNMTNTLMGVNPYRRVDLYAFAGPSLFFSSNNDADRLLEEDARRSTKMNFGANVGGRLAYHLNSTVDLVGEGRLAFLDRNKGYYSRIEAMAGMSFRVDNKRIKNVDLKTERLYLQFLGGYQVASVEGSMGLRNFSDYSQSNWGKMPNLDLRLGRRFNKAFAVQAGIFSQSAKYFDWDTQEGTSLPQYGFRGEIVANLLNMISSSYDARDTRFNWNVSGGVQISRLKSPYDKKSDFGVTAATQLQYLVTSNTWALLEARAQQITHFGIHAPISVMLGVQHDLHTADAARQPKLDPEAKKTHWQIAAGAGALNAKRGGFEAALYYKMAKNSALRLAGVGGHNGYEPFVSIDADYMANVTNVLLGMDAFRRTNLYLFGGASIMGRGVQTAIKNRKIADIPKAFTGNGVGVNYGAQVDVRLTNKLSLYTEARFVNLSEDTDFCKNHGDKVNLFTTFGVKYSLPK